VEAEYWKPFGDVVRLVPLSYFDWTELIKPEVTFADLISHLKLQIQSSVTVGPWLLVGYSIGGPLAYVCAMALQSEGQVADCLAILDGQAYSRQDGAKWRKRFENLLTFRVRAGLASIIAKVLTRERTLPLLRRLSPMRHVELPCNFGAYLHPKLKMHLMERLFFPWWHGIVQQNPELAMPTLLFRSEEHESWEPDDLGWGQYCRTLAVIHVAGSHHSILAQENLGPLCAELARVSRGSLEPQSSHR